jgi:hypothetical protein
VLLATGIAWSAQPPASITISGGVSLGAYEAGLVYYVVETMRLNPAAATPRIVTGASAGSVNGFMTILQSCGAAVADPTASLLWNAWIPRGLKKLHVPGQAQPTSAFSRAAFDAPLELIFRAWSAGLPESCDAVFGLSVTRLIPRVVTTGDERLQRVEGTLVGASRARRREAAAAHELRGPRPGEQAALLPEGRARCFAGLVDAFRPDRVPGAFPQAICHAWSPADLWE